MIPYHGLLLKINSIRLLLMLDFYTFYSFFDRLHLVFCPVRGCQTVRKEWDDAETYFEVHPEAFRMCAHLYFVFFMVTAYTVTTQWGPADRHDNPIYEHFGINNICVYFDDPPFSLFGSTLWFPGEILLLSFEVFDYIRVHDHYRDGDDRYPITKCFLIYYTISTVMESLIFIVLPQIFATSPREHLYMHTWPYLALLYAMWFVVLKRFLYRRKVSTMPWYGIVFVILCAISTIIKLVLNSANLYGARLWETYPWTMNVVQINDPTYLGLMVIGPILIHGIIGDEFDTVVVTLNRSNERDQKKRRGHRATESGIVI